MNILAVETSCPRGSVALLEGDRVVAEERFGEGTRHGRDLVPCVDRVLGGRPERVDLVAVSAGPGSYTGLRVGVTFAKVFAVEAKKPVVGVSSLDVIAANVTEPGAVCVLVDARVGQVYVALYRNGRKTVEDGVASPRDVAGSLTADTVVIGDGLRRYRDVFVGVSKVVDDEAVWEPRASSVGRLGRARFEASGGDDLKTLVPRYMGRPQAEMTWEASRNAPGRKSS